MVEIYRTCIKNHPNLSIVQNVTRGSGPEEYEELKPLGWVLAAKRQGRMNEFTYTTKYIERLNAAKQAYITLFRRAAIHSRYSNNKSVILGCYCSVNQFCHTCILALYLSIRLSEMFKDCTNSADVLAQDCWDITVWRAQMARAKDLEAQNIIELPKPIDPFKNRRKML